MSLILGPSPTAKGGVNTGFEIARAAELNQDAQAFLGRAWGTPTDSDKWTYSTWVKRARLGGAAVQDILAANFDTGNWGQLYFLNTTDQLELQSVLGSVSVGHYTSLGAWRDTSEWYHFVVAVDSLQAASADRVKMYCNGVLLSVTETTPWSQGVSHQINQGTVQHNIGTYNGALNFYDGLLAETYFIDGQQLLPTDFGFFNAQNMWEPSDYAGTYGDMGSRCSYLNAGVMGEDTSGNGNTWTNAPSPQQQYSTPSKNYAVLNTTDKGDAPILYNGSRYINRSSTGWQSARSTHWFSTGKFYFEMDYASVSDTVNMLVGLGNSQTSRNAGWCGDGSGEGFSLQKQGGTSALTILQGGVVVSVLVSTANPVNGDRLMVAFDMDTGQIWFGLNGTWWIPEGEALPGDPANGLRPCWTFDASREPWCVQWGANTVDYWGLVNNVEYQSFAAPAGFLEMTSQNMADADYAVVLEGSKYFQPTITLGDNVSPRTISVASFSPDLVWLKNLTAAWAHWLYDTVRGKDLSLVPDQPLIERNQDANGYLSAFADEAGAGNIEVSDGTSGNQNVNHWLGDTTGHYYVYWNWKRGAKQGVDVVGYAGDGIAGLTIPHSLGVAPDVMIVKRRTTAINDWVVYMSRELDGAADLHASPEDNYLLLSDSSTLFTASAIWNNTPPDAANFTVGAGNAINLAGNTYMAYLFAEVPGFFKQGTYIGNGSTNGPFCWCGFNPAYVMVKGTSLVSSWVIYDKARSLVNPRDDYLLADTADVQATGIDIDFLSNGFKIRNVAAGVNQSPQNYTYLAFAEHPFKYARAV